MTELPTGTVSFLFTDIEGSSSLWDTQPDRTARSLVRHDEIAQDVIRGHNGRLVKLRSGGDSLFAVFGRASDAVAAALALQCAFTTEGWTSGVPLRVRIGVHVGEAELRDGDYYGTQVNRCARVRDAAHGGQVLLSQVVAELTRQNLPTEASLRPLGSYHLKGMVLPETLYQICHPSLSDHFPPVNAQGLIPQVLPTQLNRFVGREKQVAEVADQLSTERLVVLTGPGGIGKTRLAVRVAEQAKDRFPQGIWFVDLAPVSEAEQVTSALLRSLGLRGEPARTATEIAQDYLRNRAAHLIIDNCEHLLESCARLVESLLTVCNELRILATSREPLHAMGETVYVVPRLSAREGTESEAVRLFVDRARAALASFQPGPEDIGCIRDVCERLEGIPLAIEIAAGTVRMMSVKEMVPRLNRQLRLFGARSQAAHARHRTLDAAIRWSYDLLSAEEKTLLQRLSIFVGGWTLEASEAVCIDETLQTEDIFFLLSSLTDKSLVVVEPGSETRYRLLEMVRVFARAQLSESGDEEVTLLRHARWAADLAETLSGRLRGGEQMAALNRLEEEHDNIRAVLRTCQEGRLDTELVRRIAPAIWWFWHVRGHLQEGRRWLELALESSAQDDSGMPSLEMLAGLGTLSWVLGDLEMAENYYNRALILCTQLENKSTRSYLLSSLGVLRSMEQGRFEEARRLYEESIEAADGALDSWNKAGALNNLGALYGVNDDFARARYYYTESLTLSRKIHDLRGVAFAVCNLAEAAEKLGDMENALASYREGESLARELGERRLLAWTVFQRAQLLLASENVSEARELFTEALSLAESLGDTSTANQVNESLAAFATQSPELSR